MDWYFLCGMQTGLWKSILKYCLASVRYYFQFEEIFFLFMVGGGESYMLHCFLFWIYGNSQGGFFIESEERVRRIKMKWRSNLHNEYVHNLYTRSLSINSAFNRYISWLAFRNVIFSNKLSWEVIKICDCDWSRIENVSRAASQLRLKFVCRVLSGALACITRFWRFVQIINHRI